MFFDSGPYAIPIIEVLRKNFNLNLVLTTEKPGTQGEALQACPVIAYCIKNKIEYLSVSNLSDQNLKSLIINHKSYLGVLAYFGLILPEEILNIFPKGILNIHPSLLPKYRGPTPGQSAILNGEKETGVTLIKLDEQVDHGPILAQTKEPILPNDTSETLYQRLFANGARLLEKNIDEYLNNKITPVEQDHKNATFTNHLTRQSGFIDLNNPPPPEKLDRMIRAYHPWPGVWSKFQTRGSTRGVDAQKIIKFLPEKKVQVEGKKPVSYKDFLNGYPQGRAILKNLDL